MHIRNHDLVTNLEIVYRDHIAAFVTITKIRHQRIDAQTAFLTCSSNLLAISTVHIEWAKIVLEKVKLNVARTNWCLFCDLIWTASLLLAAITTRVIFVSAEFVAIIKTLVFAIIRCEVQLVHC